MDGGMSRRTFIAGDVPGRVCQQLADLTRRLAADWPAGQVRWTSAQSMHITLRFLGDTREEQIPLVVEALKIRCAEATPMALTLSRVGAFPNVRQPRVIWVGIDGETTDLRNLQRHLEQDARGLGWEVEERAFRPHLTIGRRNRFLDPRRDVLPQTTGWSEIEMTPIPFVLDVVTLMESRLTPKGAVYRALHQERLS
jgi:RNA 2',3'-cyclic 3'-phosphodiesterase